MAKQKAIKGNPNWIKGGASPNPNGRPRNDHAIARMDGNPYGTEAQIIDVERLDGWQNVLTGIGTIGRDKRLSTSFTSQVVDRDTARLMWQGDDLAARAITTRPREMLREGFRLQIADEAGGKDRAEAIEQRLKDLKFTTECREAMNYENAYGGGALLIGVDDGCADLSRPLNWKTIRAINYLTPIESRELQPIYYYTDPRAPKFGDVEVWQFVPLTIGQSSDGRSYGQPIRIHESRLWIFPGVRVTREQNRNTQAGWGDSILTRMITVLQDFNISWSAAGILVHDFSQAVFKMKGLADMVTNNGAAQLQSRIAAVEMSRSVARAILIDSEEDFERKQTPVSGLPELLDRFATRLAAAIDMPLTLLMGQSPGGLNATGESDIRFFYDRIKAEQIERVEPVARYIIRIIMATMGGESKKWSIKFNPLWQPTAKEVADTRYVVAQTDALNITSGIYSAEEAAMSRFGGDEFSLDLQIDFDARASLEPAAAEPVKSAATLAAEAAAKAKPAFGGKGKFDRARPRTQKDLRTDYSEDRPRAENGQFGQLKAKTARARKAK